MAKPPIFIIGCQRSGTTLLRRILDGHPNIACPPESAFMVQLCLMYEIERSRQGLLDMNFSNEVILERMGRFAGQFFDDYAEAKGKPRWADKTNHYVNHLETIDRMFGRQPQYVIIVRHGLDVAHSLLKFDWGAVTPYWEQAGSRRLGGVKFWRDQNAKIVDFLDQAGERVILIKYEDLTREPEPNVKSIMEFLNEPWSDDLLDYNRTAHDEGFGDKQAARQTKISPNSGYYRQWEPEMIDRAYEIGRDIMIRLGYTIEDDL